MALDNGRADWAGTPWHTRDVAAMWAAVAHHSPDPYATHLAGWRRTSELLSEHIARMRAYRSDLAAVWNPDRSPAAALYLARFDADIANAQHTHDASVANYTAYAAAMNIVSEARASLKPIHEEYTANEAAVEAHRTAVAGMGHRAGAVAHMSAPDVGARQAELTGMARAVMYRASQELIEATAALQVPPLYEHRIPAFAPTAPSIRPPSIPPIIPLQAEKNAHSGTTQPAVGNQIDTPTWGPNLSSTATAPQNPATGPTPQPIHVQPNSSQPNSTTQPPGIIGAPPRSPVNGQSNARHDGSNKGYVIGAPTVRGSDITTPQKATPNGNAGHTANSAIPYLPGTGQARGSETEKSRLDADSPWKADAGIDPIIVPDPPTGEIDPGPAIGRNS